MLLFIDRYERNIAEIKETFKIQLNDLEYENRKLRHGNKQKELTMGRFKQRFSEAYMAATERVENKINILQTTRIKTVIILSLIYFSTVRKEYYRPGCYNHTLTHPFTLEMLKNEYERYQEAFLKDCKEIWGKYIQYLKDHIKEQPISQGSIKKQSSYEPVDEIFENLKTELKQYTENVEQYTENVEQLIGGVKEYEYVSNGDGINDENDIGNNLTIENKVRRYKKYLRLFIF